MSVEVASWHAVVVAAGVGQRFGAAARKATVLLAGQPLAAHSMRTLAGCPGFGGGVVVVHVDDQERARQDWVPAAGGRWEVTIGGATRAKSVQAGLAALAQGVEWVAVHDAARPLVAAIDVEAVVRRAVEVGAAILASPVVETLKRARGSRIVATVDRAELWRAETPQVFRAEWLRRGYAACPDGDTDDAAVVERLGLPVAIVRSQRPNLKVTVPSDLRIAEAVLAE